MWASEHLHAERKILSVATEFELGSPFFLPEMRILLVILCFQQRLIKLTNSIQGAVIIWQRFM